MIEIISNWYRGGTYSMTAVRVVDLGVETLTMRIKDVSGSPQRDP